MKNPLLTILCITIPIQIAYATTAKPPDLFILPKIVMGNKHQYVLIDIRNSSEYKSVHILGSINLPINSIVKKKYLKSKNLILINRGYSSDTLVKRCAKLKKQGFRVSILKGGINFWAMKELPLSNNNNIFSLFEITPLELYKSLKSTSWLAINISETPAIVELTLSKNKNRLAYKNKYLNALETITVPKPNTTIQKKELVSAIHKKLKNKKLLIYSKDSSDYSFIFNIIKNQKRNYNKSGSICNVFFLKGGLNQFNLFAKRVLKFPRARKILNSENDCDCD
jgi:rhodanese-related sulfurtransferase